jgi:hypothetical protein
MAFHLYRINELYSNADGTVQFIEMIVGPFSGKSFSQGQSTVARTPDDRVVRRKESGHNRDFTDNPDVAAYVDAYIGDFLGSRSNGAIAHDVIYGQHEQRLAFDLVGQPIHLEYSIDWSG